MTYIEPPFNYTGSKYKLLNQLLPEFDYSKNTFIDMFAGGGSVFSNVANKFDKLIVNDIIKDLIGIYEELIKSDDIIEKTKNLCPEKTDNEQFIKLRDSYNLEPSPEKLWALILSSTNNMIRFNKKFKYNQTFGKRTWNVNTDKKVNAYINYIKKFKDKLIFKSVNFNELIINNEHTMVYCDPPYGRIKDQNGNIVNKQISEAGYNNFWSIHDDINLYKYLHNVHNIGSSFVVSGLLHHNEQTSWMLDKLINDGFEYKILNYNYNKVSRNGIKNDSTEIIIKNFNNNTNRWFI